MYVVGEQATRMERSVADMRLRFPEKLLQMERVLWLLVCKEQQEVEDCVLGVILMAGQMDSELAEAVHTQLVNYRDELPLMWRLHQVNRLLGLRLLHDSAPLQRVHSEFSLFGAVAEVKLEVAELKSEVTELKSEITELKSEVAELRKRVDTLQLTADNFGRKLDDLLALSKPILRLVLRLLPRFKLCRLLLLAQGLLLPALVTLTRTSLRVGPADAERPQAMLLRRLEATASHSERVRLVPWRW